MRLGLLQFVAVISTALYLVPTGAHLFELPRKMALPPPEYLTVQGIYGNWQLFGIAIVIALLAVLVHTVLVRHATAALWLSLAAFLALASALGVFFAYTYPVNVASHFWTVLPDQFETARRQWEYSHAASAVLTFAALVAIVLSVLASRPRAAG